jgi:hypothetical protein
MQTTINSPDKLRTYLPKPRDDAGCSGQTGQHAERSNWVTLTSESEFEGTQQFLVCADEADLCCDHKCLKYNEKMH